MTGVLAQTGAQMVTAGVVMLLNSGEPKGWLPIVAWGLGCLSILVGQIVRR